MSLMIKTLSHDVIEGGFFASYTGGFRVGEYAFPTQMMHRMMRHFAEKPASFVFVLPSFGEEVFYQKSSQHLRGAFARMIQGLDSADSEREFSEWIKSEEGLFRNIGDTPVNWVPVKVSPDEENVSFGEYRVDRSNYCGMAIYTLHGGVFGWENKKFPREAARGVEAVCNSTRHLYEGITREDFEFY
jgi:hypothetical protein